MTDGRSMANRTLPGAPFLFSSCRGWCDGHAGRGGLPHELNLRRCQVVGLVDEVAEGALQVQGFGGDGALGLPSPASSLETIPIPIISINQSAALPVRVTRDR